MKSKQHIHFPAHLTALVVAALLVVVIPVRAADPAKGIAAQLQPFVDNHTLAGAVTLVASKDKMLSLETVGRGGIAAKKPMENDALFSIAAQAQTLTGAAF